MVLILILTQDEEQETPVQIQQPLYLRILREQPIQPIVLTLNMLLLSLSPPFAPLGGVQEQLGDGPVDVLAEAACVGVGVRHAHQALEEIACLPEEGHIVP